MKKTTNYCPVSYVPFLFTNVADAIDSSSRASEYYRINAQKDEDFIFKSVAKITQKKEVLLDSLGYSRLALEMLATCAYDLSSIKIQRDESLLSNNTYEKELKKSIYAWILSSDRVDSGNKHSHISFVSLGNVLGLLSTELSDQLGDLIDVPDYQRFNKEIARWIILKPEQALITFNYFNAVLNPSEHFSDSLGVVFSESDKNLQKPRYF